MTGLNLFAAPNFKGDITDCTLTETGEKRTSKDIVDQRSGVHHDRQQKSDQAQLFQSTDQKEPNRFYFQQRLQRPYKSKKYLCGQICLLIYYLAYILWLLCSSIVSRSNIKTSKNTVTYWTFTAGQIIAVIACMVLILTCSEKLQKKAIVAQLACSVAFLMLGFAKYGVSERSASVIEITVIFTVGQSIALMLMTLNQRQSEREKQLDNWLKIHPFTKTHRFSSIITKKVIKDPPLHKISSRAIEEEEVDFNRRVLKIEDQEKVEEQSYNFNIFRKNSRNPSSRKLSQKMSYRTESIENNSMLKKLQSGKNLKVHNLSADLEMSTNNDIKNQSTHKSEKLGQFGIFRHLESQENIQMKD